MLFLPNALVTQFQLVLRMNLYDTRLGYILMMAAGIGVGPLLISGYVKSVPVELDEAAALDGVGYLRYLFGFLPHLPKPVLSTVFILQAIGVWNDIILATILLPDQAKSPVSLGLFAFQGTYTSQLESAVGGHDHRCRAAAGGLHLPAALPGGQRRRRRGQRLSPQSESSTQRESEEDNCACLPHLHS